MRDQSSGRPEREGQPAQTPSGGQQPGQGHQGGGLSDPYRGQVRQMPERGTSTGRPTEDPMGQMTEQFRDQGQQTIRSLTSQVRQQASSQVNSQKDMAVESLDSVATAIHDVGQRLREQGQEPIAEYADLGAEQVQRLSSYLRHHELGDVVGEVESFARRQPVLFLGATLGLGFLAARFLRSSAPPPMRYSRGLYSVPGGQQSSSQSFEDSVEVAVPLRYVYDQWTQFESFPQFMEGVQEVRQLDEQRLHWKAEIAGKVEEWDAVITEQIPDQRITWRNTTGAHNFGSVSFDAINSTTTRVTLWIEYQPEGLVENLGSRLGFVERRVKGDLNRFKHFIESRGMPTGGWRGEIEHGNVTEPGQAV